MRSLSKDGATDDVCAVRILRHRPFGDTAVDPRSHVPSPRTTERGGTIAADTWGR